MSYGVSISGYRCPSAVRLNLRAVKAYAGVPCSLAVTDDASPLSSAVRLVCDEEGAAFLGDGTRWGHGAGYLAGLYASLKWASALGLDVLAVVSQRYVLTSKDWLAGLSLSSPIMANTGQDSVNGYHFIQTAVIVLDVPAWLPVVEDFRPRRLEGIPVECFMFDMVRAIFGRSEPLPALRAVDYRSDERERFEALAEKLGTELGDDFTLSYWRDQEGYDCG